MLYREIIAVCSQIHTKHINTLCGQNVEFVNVKLVVHIVSTGLWRVKQAVANIMKKNGKFFLTNVWRMAFDAGGTRYGTVGRRAETWLVIKTR